MNTYSKLNWLKCLSVCCFLISIVYAREQRPVRILYLSAPKGAPTDAFVYGENEFYAETALPKARFSKTFNISRGNVKLSLLPSAIEEGEIVPSAAPSVAIPESWSKVLLLVFEDQSNPVFPVSVKAINASNNVFGPQDIYLVNLSSISVSGTVADKKINLKSKKTLVIKKPTKKPAYFPVKLSKILPTGETRSFVFQDWAISRGDRRIVFFLPKPDPRFVTLYSTSIKEFESKKKPK